MRSGDQGGSGRATLEKIAFIFGILLAGGASMSRNCGIEHSLEIGFLVWIAQEVQSPQVHSCKIVSKFLRASGRGNNNCGDIQTFAP